MRGVGVCVCCESFFYVCCSLMFVARCLQRFVVVAGCSCCVVFVVYRCCGGCALFALCNKVLMVVVRCVFICCALRVVCCALFVDIFVACCLLIGVHRVSFLGCCLLIGAICFVFAVIVFNTLFDVVDCCLLCVDLRCNVIAVRCLLLRVA